MRQLSWGDRVKIAGDALNMGNANPLYKAFKKGEIHTYEVWDWRVTNLDRFVHLRRILPSGRRHGYAYTALMKDLVTEDFMKILEVPLERYL